MDETHLFDLRIFGDLSALFGNQVMFFLGAGKKLLGEHPFANEQIATEYIFGDAWVIEGVGNKRDLAPRSGCTNNLARFNSLSSLIFYALPTLKLAP